MLVATRRALVRRLSQYDPVVEIGIGRRTEVARDLAIAGVDVTATDIHERAVPSNVRFVLDDVTSPDRSIYTDASVLYALNLPPELHRPALDLATAVDAQFLFTTLGTDQPQVPVERQSIPGDTLYLTRRDDNAPL